MKVFQKINKLLAIAAIMLVTQNLIWGQEEIIPFQVSDGLFDFSNDSTLGLKQAKGTETFTIFKPSDNDPKYNHGVVLFPFNGFLYAQWQSSIRDEDAPETKVLYSRSQNGKDWDEPKILADEWNCGIKTSGGWWSYEDTLIAYICIWPENINKTKEGYTVYKKSIDGINWSDEKNITDNLGNPLMGIFEQDPHKLPNGRIINAAHMQPGLKAAPIFTDDPSGLRGWTLGKLENLPYKKEMSRELEPSSFFKNDGSIVMIFRDQAGTYKKLASISNDNGETWSEPILTNMPDSRSKQSAGNLPDGTAFMVGNPSTDKTRIPLAIVLSRDGNIFNKAFILRAGGRDLQPQMFEGKYKRKGYSYPKSVIWNDYLYISYATNKEDAEVTRIPLKNLKFE